MKYVMNSVMYICYLLINYGFINNFEIIKYEISEF